MTDIPTINLEVKKDGFQQLQSGAIKITLTCHPQDDNLADFLNAPMGQRYIAALAAIGDDEQPLAVKQPMKRSQRAYQLCKGNRFQNYLRKNFAPFVEINLEHAPTYDEGMAMALRQICGITSRSELDTNEEAAAKFDALVAEFERSV